MKSIHIIANIGPAIAALCGPRLMKTRLLVFGLVTATTLSSFGQGWFLFAATKSKAYDLTSGLPVLAGAGDSFAFLWNSGPGTNSAAGAGTSAVVAGMPGANWGQILSDPNYTLAVDANFPGNPVVAVGNGSGGWNYNGGNSFPVLGAPTTGIVDCYVIGWNNQGGRLTTPWQAANGSSLGYSSVFSYSVGALVSSPVLTFSGSGMTAFGIQGPEPSALALFSLGLALKLASCRAAVKKLPPHLN